MILEETVENNNFIYKKIIPNIDKKNDVQYKIKSKNYIKTFNNKCNENISKSIELSESNDVIEQFSKLQLSDKGNVNKTVNNKCKNNTETERFSSNKDKKNKNDADEKLLENKVYSKNCKTALCLDDEQVIKSDDDKNNQCKQLPLESFLARAPVRNCPSYVQSRKIWKHDALKKPIYPKQKNEFHTYKSSLQLSPSQDLQFKDSKEYRHDDEGINKTVVIELQQNINTNSTNSSIKSTLPGIFTFLENNENDFINSTSSSYSVDDLQEYFQEEIGKNCNDKIANDEIKEIIKTSEIYEYLKNDDNYNEIPQLTRLISEIESPTSDDNEKSSNYKERLSSVESIGKAMIYSSSTIMPSSPLHASSPPYIAVSPDPSHNATIINNLNSVSPTEAQYLKVVTSIPSPISIGLCMTMIDGNNKQPSTIVKERKILPKIENKSTINSEQRSPTNCTKKKSSRTNSINKTLQEYLGSLIPIKIKKEFIRNFFSHIRSIEEITKPRYRHKRTILHKFVLNQDLNGTYLLIEQIRAYIKSSGGILKDFIDIKDDYGYTPLFYAVGKNSKWITAYLLECKADSYIKDYEAGNTPLHIATIHGNNGLTVLRLLIQQDKHNVNITNKKGQTILHSALIYNQTETQKEKNELIRFLLKKKYKVCSQDNEGKTPLHYAIKLCAEIKKFDILQILLTEGFDSNNGKLQQDKNGRSILHDAALQNHISRKVQKELIEFIIGHCSDLLEIKDKDGKLPYELISSERTEIKEILQYKWDNRYGYISFF